MAAGRKSVAASSTRSAATLVVKMAGWAWAVRASSLSGPSKQSREIENPRAASASSKTARACGWAAASACPMPTFCEPCPGKRNARIAGHHLTTAEPQASPPPSAVNSRMSPVLIRPCSSASSSEIGRVAEEVFP